MNVEELFAEQIKDGNKTITGRIRNVFPVKRAIFIDSTWNQTKSIYKDERLRELPCVVLKSRISQFWRHQKKSPRWYLATIEAIHQFLVELHICAFGATEEYALFCAGSNDSQLNERLVDIECDPTQVPEIDERYSGQYDNLLYFFKYMYEKIHTIYDHDKLWAYKRPLI